MWWFAFGCGVGFMVGLFYRSIEAINMSMICWELQGKVECLTEELDNKQSTEE